MFESIRTVPRTALNGYFRALRLPLSLVERAAKQQGNESWPPAIAFESVEARIESAAGFLLRDDRLLESAQLRETKIAELRQARTLSSAAQVKRDNAREEQLQRKATISIERGRAERAAEERKAEKRAKAEQAKRDAALAASKRASAVKAQQAAQQEVLERRERAAKSEALDAQSEALDLTDRALDARERIDRLDDAVEATKAARKGS